MLERLTHSKTSLLALAIISLGISGLAFQDAFAAPSISTYVADDPDNADNVYSDGDTITINLSSPGNVTVGVITDLTYVTGNFTFPIDDPLAGATYTAEWVSNTQLVLTLTSIGGNTLQIGTSTVDPTPGNSIGDDPSTGDPGMSSGDPDVVLSGDFGSLTGSSQCDRDCTPPTMGPNTKGDLIVEDGFSYNGHAVNVAAWHTEYPLIVVQTGKMNVLQAKIHDDWGEDNINSVRIAFGVPEIGKLFQGETVVEYHPNEIVGSQINVIDKNHLLDKVSITTEKTNCNSSENSPVCTLLTMNHMFREAPLSNVVGISLSDGTRNSAQFYFNDGVKVDGESLNSPQTAIQTLNKKGTPQIQLTQIDRGEDLWLDEQNNLWFKNSFGTWIKITPDEDIKVNSEPIAKNGIDRMHPLFNTYKLGQELLAIQIWNSDRIQSVLPDYTTVEFDGIYRMDDPQLQKTMLDEIKKAEQIYVQIYD